MNKIAVFLVTILVWQTCIWIGSLPPYILPSPTSVFSTLIHERNLLWENSLVTFYEVIAGCIIGSILGIGAAVLMAVSSHAARFLKPLLVATQALPVFVLAPVLTIWLGFGPEPKVAMTVLLVFFPIASGLLDGLTSTPDDILDLARISGAGRWRAFFWLRWPYAMPQFGAGLRIAMTYAPTGAVIGEWVGASKGLGYLMLMSNARMRIELMFAALVVIVVLTIFLNAFTDRILKRFDM